MTDEEVSPETVLDFFSDQLARQILVVATGESVSIKDLQEYCDASRATIYRRTTELADAGLLFMHPRVDQKGHDCREFRTAIDELTVRVEDGTMTAVVRGRPDVAETADTGREGLEGSIGSIRPEVETGGSDDA